MPPEYYVPALIVVVSTLVANLVGALGFAPAGSVVSWVIGGSVGFLSYFVGRALLPAIRRRWKA
jgi:hypothetical protein